MTPLTLVSPATTILDTLRSRLDGLAGPELLALRRVAEQAETKDSAATDGTGTRCSADKVQIQGGQIVLLVPFAFILSTSFLPGALSRATPAVRATLDSRAFSLIAAAGSKAATPQAAVEFEADKAPVAEWLSSYADALDSREEILQLKTTLAGAMCAGDAPPSADLIRTSQRTVTIADTEITIQLSPNESKKSEFAAALLSLLNPKQMASLDSRLTQRLFATPSKPKAPAAAPKPAPKAETKVKAAPAPGANAPHSTHKAATKAEPKAEPQAETKPAGE